VIENWIEGIIGVWILLSPWLLGFSNLSIPKWSSILCGLTLTLVNVWSLFGEKNQSGEKDKPKGPSN
jgi:hypothetical protein